VHTAVLYLTAALAVLLWVRAGLRCYRQVTTARTRAARAAHAARVVELARYRWDAGTRALEAGLRPLLDVQGVHGFGDGLVAQEHLRAALRAAEEASR